MHWKRRERRKSFSEHRRVPDAADSSDRSPREIGHHHEMCIYRVGLSRSNQKVKNPLQEVTLLYILGNLFNETEEAWFTE